MNADTIMRIVKDILLSFGSILATAGWVTETQWAVIVGAVIGVASVLWQVYVKWNTVAVPADAVAHARTITGTKIPVVDPVTGQVT